jgi:hypothetical protein
MKTIGILLIIVGFIIFVVSIVGGVILSMLPVPDIYLSILWLVGLGIAVLGGWLYKK